MALKLMYITNNPEVALIAEKNGVDRIFVDMEWIGKTARQGGMDTVQSHHTIEDILAVRKAIEHAELLVRINPIHEATACYGSSKEEVDEVIRAGADIVMLPYFKTLEEAKRFTEYVDGRAKTMLLVETPEAVEIIEDILALPGIDEVYVGLNDLSLGYGMKFMFEPLANGVVEKLTDKCRRAGILFGFGGIAMPGRGDLPSEYVIREHCRLGSSSVILSRSFCNTQIITDLSEVERIFAEGVQKVRMLEAECAAHMEEKDDFLERNRVELVEKVKDICRKK